jgi:hypothetical protein
MLHLRISFISYAGGLGSVEAVVNDGKAKTERGRNRQPADTQQKKEAVDQEMTNVSES